jgi:4-hydroxybenzoate polyprenyltransferase
MIETTFQIQYERPLWRRLAAWADERFPAKQGVLVLVVWALGVLFGRALTHPGPVSLSALDVTAFPALWAYFLLLRVFDEHKDYELDLRNHPHRVLQSGQVTLAHLKLVGAVAAAVQLGDSILIDHGIGRVTAIWALLMVWTLLMLKEFFVEWPPSRFVLYAFMHMISMPLTLLWLAQAGAGAHALTPGVRLLALLGGLIGAVLEVGRKFRAPEHERDTIDTYTRQLGVVGASAALSAIVAGAALVAVALIATATSISPLLYTLPLLAVVPALAATARFAGGPRAPAAESVETMAGVAVLLLVVASVVILLAARGIG